MKASFTRWEIVEGTAADGVVIMRVSPQARKKCPNLPETWRVRAITVIDQSARRHVLLTSLFDRQRYKASDIALCYARRWHIDIYQPYNLLKIDLTVQEARDPISQRAASAVAAGLPPWFEPARAGGIGSSLSAP